MILRKKFESFRIFVDLEIAISIYSMKRRRYWTRVLVTVAQTISSMRKSIDSIVSIPIVVDAFLSSQCSPTEDKRLSRYAMKRKRGSLSFVLYLFHSTAQ